MDVPPSGPIKQWDPQLYDGRHSFVWKYGAEVIALLSPQPGERILDLGCGTGHLTHQIAQAGARVVGLDLSAAMIEKARQAYPDIEFAAGDGTQMQFAEPFDAVFSNAALHWMRQPELVARSVAKALKPGGRFVAEFGAKGNLRAVHEALEAVSREVGWNLPGQSPRYFPTLGEYAGLLERCGFHVSYAAAFDRPTPLDDGENGLRHWMEMFTSDYLAGIAPDLKGKIFDRVEARLRPVLYQNGTWTADYRRLRFAAIREQEG